MLTADQLIADQYGKLVGEGAPLYGKLPIGLGMSVQDLNQRIGTIPQDSVAAQMMRDERNLGVLLRAGIPVAGTTLSGLALMKLAEQMSPSTLDQV